jgi:hypothetical protein
LVGTIVSGASAKFKMGWPDAHTEHDRLREGEVDVVAARGKQRGTCASGWCEGVGHTQQARQLGEALTTRVARSVS